MDYLFCFVCGAVFSPLFIIYFSTFDIPEPESTRRKPRWKE